MVQGMTEAEAKRQQQRRAWDAEHLRSIGTKLTPVELARLDAYCFWIRTTRYSLLRTLVLEELAAYERENRVTLDAPRAVTETAAERDAAYRMLQDEYEQLCVEYVSDYYAERGEEWWPYK